MGGRESYRLLRSSVSCLSVLGEAVCSIQSGGSFSSFISHGLEVTRVD